MGFNVFLFAIVQLGLEPWRRRRLVGGFEEKVREVIQEETLRSTLLRLEHPHTVETAVGIVNPVEEQDEMNSTDVGVISQAVEDAITPESEAQTVEEALSMQTPDVRWGKIPEKVSRLFSEQVISLRRRDLTAVVVESAAVGSVVTGVIAFLWNR